MASNSQDNVTLAQGIPTVGVGQSLKTARELTGKGIEEVAQQLRIRTPFLQALEDGRHKDLPGGTYAVGFLRTYAEFLGLDGEEMVRRFRAEAAGELNARSELVFPSPVSEGRIPGGAVLFLGLLLAGVAYGGWYFLSSRTTEVAEMVPPLPDRLASALNRPATVTGDAAKPEEAAKPDEIKKTDEPAAPSPVGKDTEVVPPPEEEEAKAPTATPAPATPATTPPAAPPAVAATPANTPKADAGKLEAGKVEQAKPGQPAPAVQPGPAPASVPAPAAPQQQQQQQQQAAATPATPATTTPTPTPTPVPAPAAPAVTVPDGKVIGQEHSDSRVQLKAVSDDCWVQVRELDGQLLLSRLLRRGDSYMVPNRPGLTLMVGNAGALEVTVDGKKAAPLGNSGQVRRDIKLDPDKLSAGN